MRNVFKKLIVISTAAVMSAGVLSLAACASTFEPLKGDYSSETAAVSNGGFVVEYGNYVYFINGVESYTSDNTYGTPVKGALMRIEKSDLAARENNAETVIPSLMVAGDYTSGIYIYDGRVYYATPNNVKNTSGEIENDYLDFKSAKLDGSDIRSYFRVSDNSTVYRFVQAGTENGVYLVYKDGSDLHSYDTVSKTDTVLAKSVSAYVLNSGDKTDPWIYYTMSVSDNIDSDSAISLSYNQVYRVRADATKAPEGYDYEWDGEYLDDHDGEAPYTNLGEIVLDGIGKAGEPTRFTHDLKDGVEPTPPIGYTYTLQSYANGGLYFVRKEVTSIDSNDGGYLYYLSLDKVNGGNWNSIAGNTVGDSLEVVAQPSNTSKASSSAIFYLDEDGGHHYIYVQDENIIRADVANDGSGENVTEQEICYDASGATLVGIDNTSDADYHYVYFTRSNGSGASVERAVYNGQKKNYDVLDFGDEDNAPYKAVKVLDLQHASSWYAYEILDGTLFFADAESIGSTSYSYVSTVSLKDGDALMNNKQIEELNQKYNEIMDGDDGYLAKLTSDGETNLSAAVKYFFYTGKTDAFEQNIKDAVAAGKSETHLYTEEEQTALREFAEAKGETEGKFVDEDGKSYRTRSYFITRLGALSETDEEAIDDYWTSALQHYTAEEEDEQLPAWAWALIGVAIGLVVAGAGLAAYLIVRRKKRAQGAPKPERMRVDTTDDRSVDVYATEEPEAQADPEEDAEEASEEAPTEE